MREGNIVKKRGLAIVVLLVCWSISAVSAWGMVAPVETVSPDGSVRVAADQAYAGMVSGQDSYVPEFPTIAAPLGLIIGLLGILFALRNRYFSFQRNSVNKR